MSRYAVVTGASTGLGRCIALELAKRHIDTLLAALPGENLRDVCLACRDYGTLVNNAGLGGSRSMDDVPQKYIDTIIQVNVAATAILTHEFIPALKKNSPSYILNISSMAGIIPTGYKTVYPASKAFIKHFSLGMREELKPYGVSVSFAVLGPMPTKQEIISRINRQGFIGKSLSVSPERVAATCVKKLLGKRRVIVPGKLNALSFHLVKLIPEHLRGILVSRSVRKNEL